MDDKLDKVLRTLELLLTFTEDNSSTGEFEAAQSRAQALITKYHIQEAQLGKVSKGQSFVPRRIEIDGPYAHNKVVLLNVIAKRNFCKVLKGRGYALVYGYESDIDLVLSLYQLLLLHMTSEMATAYNSLYFTEEDVHPVSWKKSFLSGYAAEIGSRLDQVKDGLVGSVSGSSAVVLRDKQHSLEVFWDQLPKGDKATCSVNSSDGYFSGRDSGTRADLGQTRLKSTPALGR